MAESKARIEFQAKRELFDKIASKLTCNFCKNIPRDGPIYQNAKGVTACSSCKKSDFHQFFGLEEMFQYRDVQCIDKFCKEICAFVKLTDHLKKKHMCDLLAQNKNVERNGSKIIAKIPFENLRK